ncbi:MAG: peptidoglycan DD-metalloendopeptidase family protein [Actinomycetota bacterium]|nr:peptidoglycan DD-metalloendopeptidase family protein [Actinomycetota bacterium]
MTSKAVKAAGGALAAVTAAGGLALSGGSGSAAGAERPNFQAPFPCGQPIRMETFGHAPALDIFRDPTKSTEGNPLVAPAAGVVNQSYSDPAGAGNVIQINHGGGWFTTYIHLQSRAVEVGTRVQQGTAIGRVGHTGPTSNGVPHLHFEMATDRNGDGRAEWGYPNPERVPPVFNGATYGQNNGQTSYTTSRNCRPADDYTVGTFNMYGHLGNKGGTEVADAVVDSVNDRKPLVVALQEVCETQAEHIDKELPNYKVFFDPSLHEDEWNPEHEDDPLCGDKDGSDGDGTEFGNAVLYDTEVMGEDPVSYGYPLSEQRKMACVFGEATNVAACSVHLSTKTKERTSEAERVRLIARDELRHEFPDAPTFDGRTRIIGGDFNGRPDSLDDDTTDHMYHRDYGSGAKGEFKEVDSPCGDTIKDRGGSGQPCRDGESTTDDWGWFEEQPWGTKIDYIFIDRHVQIGWADATSSDHSDHDPLWAGVRF